MKTENKCNVCWQTSKMLSSCLTGHLLTRWKSLTASVVTWSGLWARILPSLRSCTSLENPRLKVGCVHIPPTLAGSSGELIMLGLLFLCGELDVHYFTQTCRPKCSTLSSFCPYTNTSAGPRTAEPMRTLWRASGCLTRRGMARLWELSSGTFWQPWVSWTLWANFMTFLLQQTISDLVSGSQVRRWVRTRWSSWCKTKRMLMVA